MVTARVESRVLSFLVTLAIVACITRLAEAKEASAGSTPVTPTINIATTTIPSSKRQITLDDMLSLQQVHEPRRSPDGRYAAFLVKQAFRVCDCYKVALYVMASDETAKARKLAESDYIANLQWSPDGRFLTYLSSKGGSVQIWRTNVLTRKSDRVFVHVADRDRSSEHVAFQSQFLPASGVLDYLWSPDGTQIAFVAETPIDPAISAMAVKQGYRYDDTTMQALDLIVGDWASANRSKQLWLYDVRQRRTRMVWTTPGGSYSSISALTWSPNGNDLVFFHSGMSRDLADSMSMVNCWTWKVTDLADVGGTLDSSASTAWSPDGDKIALIVRSLLANSYRLKIWDASSGVITDRGPEIYPGHSPWVAWDRGRILFLSEGIELDRRQTGIYWSAEEGEVPLRISAASEKVDDCDAVRSGAIVCVRQSPSTSPQPALISATDGSARNLADINREISMIELSPVREMHWKNDYGNETNGFLILPSQQTYGTHVPLVIMGYAFSGEFVTTANPILTTYPAQAFARDGIAVLLFNYPRFHSWRGNDFAQASTAYGYGPLSSMKAIIRQLSDEGIVDSHRVGMMGHSLAGFWAQLAITQTNLFVAVEMHNGGTLSEPGSYWETGMKQTRVLQEHIMGGPPYDDTLKNYSSYSFGLNSRRVRAPVLMEYDALESLSAMEYYEAMQHYGVPVEFFVYPSDGHVTERPEHRLVSMQRNLDWFEFWLLDKENDASSKVEQYARWRQLRLTVQRRSSNDASQVPADVLGPFQRTIP